MLSAASDCKRNTGFGFFFFFIKGFDLFLLVTTHQQEMASFSGSATMALRRYRFGGVIGGSSAARLRVNFGAVSARRAFAAAAATPPSGPPGSLRHAEKSAELETPDDPRWDMRNTEISGQISRRLKRILLPRPFWYPEATEADISAKAARDEAAEEAARRSLIEVGDREMAALEALEHIPSSLRQAAMTTNAPPPCRRQLFPTWRPPLAYGDYAAASEVEDGDQEDKMKKRRRKKKKKKKAKK